MNFVRLKSFATLMHYRNVTKAASELCITQSAMTKRLNTLEKELGVKLFELLGKQFVPTVAATKLLPHAQRMLLEYQNSIDTLHGTNLSNSCIKIGISAYVAAEHLSDYLSLLNEKSVSHRVQWYQIETQEIPTALRNASLDMVIGTQYIHDFDSIYVEEVGVDRLVCVKGKKSNCIITNPMSVVTLSQHPAVFPRTGNSIRDKIAEITANQGCQLNLAAEINQLAAIKEVIKQHNAWGLLPERYIDDSLISINCPDLPNSLAIKAFLHQERANSSVLQSVVALLRGKVT